MKLNKAILAPVFFCSMLFAIGTATAGNHGCASNPSKTCGCSCHSHGGSAPASGGGTNGASSNYDGTSPGVSAEHNNPTEGTSSSTSTDPKPIKGGASSSEPAAAFDESATPPSN